MWNVLTHLILTQSYELGATIFHILQMNLFPNICILFIYKLYAYISVLIIKYIIKLHKNINF